MNLTQLKAVTAAVGLVVGMLASTAASAAPWTAWAVGSTGSTVVNGDGTVTFTVGTDTGPVWSSGQTHSKAFYSTGQFNGLQVSSLSAVNYTLVNPISVTGLEGPYLNIAVTDGLGGFSFLLADAAPAPVGQQSHVLNQRQFSFNETTGSTLMTFITSLGAADSVHDGKNWYDYSDIAGLTIAAGFASNLGAVAPTAGWVGAGSSDGVILALGNRGSSPQLTATIGNVEAIPEPASLALVGLALSGLAFSRRRKPA